jgi:hypothetical protein
MNGCFGVDVTDGHLVVRRKCCKLVIPAHSLLLSIKSRATHVVLLV